MTAIIVHTRSLSDYEQVLEGSWPGVSAIEWDVFFDSSDEPWSRSWSSLVRVRGRECLPANAAHLNYELVLDMKCPPGMENLALSWLETSVPNLPKVYSIISRNHPLIAALPSSDVRRGIIVS